MKIIFLTLAFVISCLLKDWGLYFENKEIEISFKTSLCEDVQNGVSFEYYLIQVKNKTAETLVVNFHLGNLNEKSEENKIVVVLKPGEIKSGSCDYQATQLRLFKSKNSTKKGSALTNFNLNSISTIEVH